MSLFEFFISPAHHKDRNDGTPLGIALAYERDGLPVHHLSVSAVPYH